MAGEEIGGVDSKGLARSVAEELVGRAQEEPEVPGEDLSQQIAEAEASEEAEVEVPESEVDEILEEAEVEIEEEEEEEVEYDELTMELARAGIDLGVSRSELAPDLRPVYDRLAEEALTQASRWEQQQEQLESAQAEIQQFAQKLQEDPEKVLLTMAITNPEAFQHSIEIYERMQEDEFYRDTMIKDLQAEAKMAAVERQSRIAEARRMERRVAEVTRATHVAADRYGVDKGLAEELVAAAITRGGGDIDIREVPKIVGRLQGTRRSTVPAGEKLERTKRAPSKSVSGHGEPISKGASDEPELSPGLTAPSRNRFLGLIKDASRRVGVDRE